MHFTLQSLVVVLFLITRKHKSVIVLLNNIHAVYWIDLKLTYSAIAHRANHMVLSK